MCSLKCESDFKFLVGEHSNQFNKLYLVGDDDLSRLHDDKASLISSCSVSEADSARSRALAVSGGIKVSNIS